MDKKFEFIGENPKPEIKKSAGIFEKLGQLVQKTIDCCKE